MFTTKPGDTTRTVAGQLGIPVKEFQDKTYDLPGSCKRTGRTDPDSVLIPETGLWVKDPENDGEGNALTRVPGPRTLADFIPADSGITTADADDACDKLSPGSPELTGSEEETKDSARDRFHDAVTKQEQQEIENALLAEHQPADESAGGTPLNQYQDELFGDFVRTNSPKGPPSQKASPWYHGRLKQRPRGRNGRSRRDQPRPGGRHAPRRGLADPTPKSWRPSPSTKGRRRWKRHGNNSSRSHDR